MTTYYSSTSYGDKPWTDVSRKKFPKTWAMLVKLYFGGTWHNDTRWVSTYVTGKSYSDWTAEAAKQAQARRARTTTKSDVTYDRETSTWSYTDHDGAKVYGGKSDDYTWETITPLGKLPQTTYSLGGHKFATWQELQNYKANAKLLGLAHGGNGGKVIDVTETSQVGQNPHFPRPYESD